MNYGACPAHEICSLPVQIVREMAQGKAMPLEKGKTRRKWEATLLLLLHRAVKKHAEARTPSISGSVNEKPSTRNRMHRREEKSRWSQNMEALDGMLRNVNSVLQVRRIHWRCEEVTGDNRRLVG